MSRKEDITGMKFGMLTALHEDKDNRLKWIFQCDCGNIKSINKANVKSGETRSCGCLLSKRQRSSYTGRKRVDLTGKRFGKLTVTSRAEDIISSKGVVNSAWNCICDCGQKCVVRTNSLNRGVTISCGCHHSEAVSKKFSKNLEGQKFGRLTAIKRDGTYTDPKGNKYSLWKCKCECGCFKTVRGHDLLTGRTCSCGCLASKGEEATRFILNELNIEFDTQYSFPNLLSDKGRYLFFDFAIKKKGNVVGLIEYQGRQHYEVRSQNFGKRQREVTDIQKREYCTKNSIPLLEIRYDEDIKEKVKRFLEEIKY